MKLLSLPRLFIALILCSACAEDTSNLVGIYSNKAEGFYTKSVILDVNGKGIYAGGASAMPVLWKKAGDTITLTCSPAKDQKDVLIALKYSESKKELQIIDQEYAEGSKPLQFIQSEIPERYHQMLSEFDGTLKSLEQ